MVPGLVTLISNYWLLQRIHLVNTYTVLIAPANFSAFDVFLLRQSMLGIPTAWMRLL
jgi:ABC-type glycerol-3-phosphate transport system permease component